MSEHWKKHDRPCPPCADCGAELYEKFWGNGGWAKTDKATDKSHGERDCVRRLKTKLEDAIRVACAASNDAERALREAELL